MQKIAEDLISLPIEMNKALFDTKFRLVHIASQRVRQLSAGEPLEVSTQSIKDTTVALEEAVAGRLKALTGEEARKEKEEFLKQEEQARIAEQLSAKEEEIRKELSAYLSEAQEEEATDESGADDLGDEKASSDLDQEENTEE